MMNSDRNATPRATFALSVARHQSEVERTHLRTGTPTSTWTHSKAIVVQVVKRKELTHNEAAKAKSKAE
jgi:hypothetical protein